MPPTNLGELEQLVLLAIARLGDDAYGVTVRKEIATRTRRDLSLGSVYTTLDQDDNRFITLEPGMYKEDEAENKPIFPNVFSRASGHAFICVSRSGDRLEPREFREYTDDEETTARRVRKRGQILDSLQLGAYGTRAPTHCSLVFSSACFKYLAV